MGLRRFRDVPEVLGTLQGLDMYSRGFQKRFKSFQSVSGPFRSVTVIGISGASGSVPMGFRGISMILKWYQSCYRAFLGCCNEFQGNSRDFQEVSVAFRVDVVAFQGFWKCSRRFKGASCSFRGVPCLLKISMVFL